MVILPQPRACTFRRASRNVGSVADTARQLLSPSRRRTPSNFLMLGGGSEFPRIAIPIPFLSDLLCLIDCDSSNGDQPTRPPHSTSQTHIILGEVLIDGQRSAAGEIVPVGILIPFDIPEDPSNTNFNPGPGWKLGKNGKTWKNDSLRQKLKADPDHEPPIGPHFDWQSTRKKKIKLRIRRRGYGIEYWNNDLGESGDWELLEPLGWFLE